MRAETGSGLMLWESTFQGLKLSVVTEESWSWNKERSRNLLPETITIFVFLPEKYLGSSKRVHLIIRIQKI